MTDKQPEALRLAKMLTADVWPGSVTLVSYARECVAELRRQHEEIETLRAGYAAARLALVQYGAHDGACSVGNLDDEGLHCACDCGYESAIKAAEDKALNAELSGPRPEGRARTTG